MSATSRANPGANASLRVADRLKTASSRCGPMMAAYGACIQLNMPDVGKGACEREVEALKACVFAKK